MKESKKIGYWRGFWNALKSSKQGLQLTLKHLKEAREQHNFIDIKESSYFEHSKGVVTLEYPEFKLDIPEIGRNTLHCEIDDCIVCDKCAKVCPVNCIEIEAIKSPEAIGETSDGTTKRLYASKFDIDMSKCCFCGLCTTVCPTECLTMTDNYGVATFTVNELNYPFANMSNEEISQRKQEYDLFVLQKEAAKKVEAKVTEVPISENTPITEEPVKPAYRPGAMKSKPVIRKPSDIATTPSSDTTNEVSKEEPIVEQPSSSSDVVIPTTEEPAKPAYRPGAMKSKPVMRKPAAPPSENPISQNPDNNNSTDGNSAV